MTKERLEQIRKRHSEASLGYNAASNQTYAEHVGELLKYIDSLTQEQPPRRVEKSYQDHGVTE